MSNFFQIISDIIMQITDAMDSTTNYLDSVNFTQSYIFDFMGYTRFVLGDFNYVALTGAFIIAVGMTIWGFCVKAVGYLKNFLPW